jgi:outer membrane receptor protein involved in Fe transport
MKRGLAFLVAIAAASPAVLDRAAAQTIVVTAERRPQETSALAGNAAVLAGDELDRIGAQAPSEALNRLPGVAVHRNNGVENLPAIRSPVLVGGQSAGSFLVLEDGVQIRAPGFANVNQLFETSLDFAERVEIVRGPGSALYGSNAVHGIVNVVTPTPGRRGPNCSDASKGDTLETSVGSFGRISASASTVWGFRGGASCLRGDVGAVSESASAPSDSNRLGLWIGGEYVEGWRDDAELGRQNGLIGWDADLGPWAMEMRAAYQNLNQETAGFIEGARAYDDTALARTNPVPEAYRDAQLARARATLSRDLGSDWRVSFTPYARWLDADLNLFFFPSRAQELTKQIGAGVLGAVYYDPADDLSLIFGIDVDRTRGSVLEFQARATQPNGYMQGLHFDYDVDMTVGAVYGQAKWAFADDWRLVAGLRGEWVDYDYDNHAPDGAFGRFLRPADRSDAFDAVMPKLGLVWTPGEAGSVWINLASGARPPQITDLYSLQATQAPGEQGVEKLDSVELGWRGAIGESSFEIALYHMDKRDTSFRNADGFTVTDGATRHQGVELSGAVPIGDAFEFSGWITYARHTYRFDDPVSRAGESISSGDDVDTAPRWIWNARLAWRPVEAIETELEWVHMGEYFTNASNTRSYPGHELFNLRAAWTASETVTLFGAIRNLMNTDYAERADFAFGNDRYFPGEDRAYTIGVRARR